MIHLAVTVYRTGPRKEGFRCNSFGEITEEQSTTDNDTVNFRVIRLSLRNSVILS